MKTSFDEVIDLLTDSSLEDRGDMPLDLVLRMHRGNLRGIVNTLLAQVDKDAYAHQIWYLNTPKAINKLPMSEGPDYGGLPFLEWWQANRNGREEAMWQVYMASTIQRDEYLCRRVGFLVSFFLSLLWSSASGDPIILDTASNISPLVLHQAKLLLTDMRNRNVLI